MPARWMAANLSYLRDNDYLQERISSSRRDKNATAKAAAKAKAKAKAGAAGS